MASILEQFEEASRKFPVPTISQGSFEALEDEPPMFMRRSVNFQPWDNIEHLCACNDIVLISMANNIMLRIHLRQSDVPEEIDLSKYTSTMKVSRLFLSPNGQHALLTLVARMGGESQPEFLYLPRNSTKLKVLPKFRGTEVTALAWCPFPVSSNSSGSILVGTSRGSLIETEVCPDADSLFAAKNTEYWVQVFDIGKGSRIKGLEAYIIDNRHHVLVTTGNKIFHFTGKVSSQEDKPLWQQMFRTYLQIPERSETIGNLSKTSKLELFYSPNDSSSRKFGWLTDTVLFYGPVPEGSGDDCVLENCEKIRYPDSSVPSDFVLTKFHVLLLYPNHIKGVSLLTQKIVFEDYFISPESTNPNPHDAPRHLLREPMKGTLFVYTDKAVYTYKVTKEDRSMWQVYVERGEFDKARDYCHDNALYLDQVTSRQAEALFNEKDYELSAYYYSQSASISFEEIALKFLRVNETPPLVKFLRLRLDGLQPTDSMQRTMLVVWLIELYLSQIGKCTKGSSEHHTLQSELDELLSIPSVKECVSQNKGTIYDLMAAHNDRVNVIKLSLEHHDYDRVVRQHIYKGEHIEALNVLKANKFDPKCRELLYNIAPTLIPHIPSDLVQALTQHWSNLSPVRLLPALALTYDNSSAARDTSQYLQHCVDSMGCTDQSVHNLLLALYVRHQPDRLRIYLSQQGQDAASVHYDIHFALRLCQEKGLTEACVQLSALLGLWATAVELALTVNVDLAIQTANLHQSDPDFMKTLWLKIAEHVVRDKHDIKAAMKFLKKCPLLKIEDILPFFEDFVTIDDFKEAICDSLQEYSQNIQDLKDEMDDSSKSAELIVQELSAFKNRHVVITWKDTCCGCELQLLLRSFYCFPCGHHYHTDCLQEFVVPSLSPATTQRLRELQRQLKTVGADDVSTASSTTTARDLVQSSIDSILGAECCLCGNDMVESIDRPFIPESDYDRVLREWD